MRIVTVLLAAFAQLVTHAARGYVRRAAFTVPFTFGAVGGWLLGHWALAHGLRYGPYPLGWLPLAWAVIAGVALAAAARQWLDRTFGNRR